jgi:tellurite resistance-related uncharacterized protein
MEHRLELPDGLEHVRTTDVFDEQHHPAGLLRAHRVAEGVWARLIVHSGALGFTFDDVPDEALTVAAGDSVVIPPACSHHIAFDGPVTFAIAFYRRAGTGTELTGRESSGLDP